VDCKIRLVFGGLWLSSMANDDLRIYVVGLDARIGLGGGGISDLTFEQTVLPEPSGFSVFGFGTISALVFFLYRRRAKQTAIA
jgi:hypothetical protein